MRIYLKNRISTEPSGRNRRHFSIERTAGTFDVFWLGDDTFAVGGKTRFRIRVRGGGETLAAATRSVVVGAASRTDNC